jgi:hypothetical protein
MLKTPPPIFEHLWRTRAGQLGQCICDVCCSTSEDYVPKFVAQHKVDFSWTKFGVLSDLFREFDGKTRVNRGRRAT